MQQEHAQNTGVLEKRHATMKTSLKVFSGEFGKWWHKYLPIAILNYSTTYHKSIRCEHSRIFHWRVPSNLLVHKLGIKCRTGFVPTTDFAGEFLRRTQILYDTTKKKEMQSCNRYKTIYDKEARASPLKRNNYCYVLQPKLDHQGSKVPFRDLDGLAFM